MVRTARRMTQEGQRVARATLVRAMELLRAECRKAGVKPKRLASATSTGSATTPTTRCSRSPGTSRTRAPTRKSGAAADPAPAEGRAAGRGRRGTRAPGRAGWPQDRAAPGQRPAGRPADAAPAARPAGPRPVAAEADPRRRDGGRRRRVRPRRSPTTGLPSEGHRMPQSQDGETFRPDVTILPGPQAAPVRRERFAIRLSPRTPRTAGLEATRVDTIHVNTDVVIKTVARFDEMLKDLGDDVEGQCLVIPAASGAGSRICSPGCSSARRSIRSATSSARAAAGLHQGAEPCTLKTLGLALYLAMTEKGAQRQPEGARRYLDPGAPPDARPTRLHHHDRRIPPCLPRTHR